MRPIDADRVIRHLVSFKSPVEFSEIEEANNRAINDCIGEILAAPTLDVKPVVHAHWIRTAIDDGNKGYIRCSNCGADFSLPVHKMQGFYQRYCGSCGAKMDDEIDDRYM